MTTRESQGVRIISMATEAVRDKVPFEVPSADQVFMSNGDFVIILPVNTVELFACQAEGRRTRGTEVAEDFEVEFGRQGVQCRVGVGCLTRG